MKRTGTSTWLAGILLAAGMLAAENPARAEADVFAHGLDWSAHAANPLDLGSPGRFAGDSHFDGMLFAGGKTAAAKDGANVSLRAGNEGMAVGISQEFSTWSDLTAVFRPSRWKSPLREGGSLSWLNYKAWGNAPGRTAKVLLGEAIVAGAAYAVVEAIDGGGSDHNDPETTQPATTSSSSETSGTSSGGSGSNGNNNNDNDDDDDDNNDDPTPDPIIVDDDNGERPF